MSLHLISIKFIMKNNTSLSPSLCVSDANLSSVSHVCVKVILSPYYIVCVSHTLSQEAGGNTQTSGYFFML